jgi:hypothetical protein
MTTNVHETLLPGTRDDGVDRPTEAAPATQRASRLLRWAAIALGAVVLGLLFASYLSPDMAFTLMTQAWGCL